MYTITQEQLNKVPNDYKGIYSSDNIHGTNYDGLKTLLIWEEGKGTVLLIENFGFKVVASEKENINPFKNLRQCKE